MRKWEGSLGSRSLSDKAMKVLRGRIENILTRHAVPPAKADHIIGELAHEISCGFAGHEHTLGGGGRGRPAGGPANLLSVGVADVLRKHQIGGSWLGGGTEEEDGQMGIVAELEAVAQTALREACRLEALEDALREARKLEAVQIALREARKPEAVQTALREERELEAVETALRAERELKAAVQTALRKAHKLEGAAMARPARISEARKMLGKIDRN